MSLFYDDFLLGKEFESRERTIGQEDIKKFAELTGDMNRLHLDEEYAKNTIYGRPIAHGMLTLSLALGLWYSMDLTRNSIIAFLGLNNLSFESPVYPGDRIHLLSRVLNRRESRSRPDAGIVTLKDSMIKSSGQLVMQSERTLLLKKEP